MVSEEGEVPEGLAGEVVGMARSGGVLEALGGRAGESPGLGIARDEYRYQAGKGAFRLRELREIAGGMRERGIPVAPLKGMAYGLMFEDGGPTRAMGDMDLLVPEQRYEEALGVMRGLGYRDVFMRMRARAPGYHERAMVRGGSLVEIHRYFLPGRRITVDYEALWGRSLPMDRDGVSCWRLSPEDSFLYHCFHMGMHEFALGGLRAVWELRRLLRMNSFQVPSSKFPVPKQGTRNLELGTKFNVAARRAREWGTGRITWCALRLLEFCFPGAPESDSSAHSPVIKMFEPDLAVRIVLERFVVEPSIELLTSPGLLPRPVQLLRKALLVDRVSGALSYLVWHARVSVEGRLGGWGREISG